MASVLPVPRPRISPADIRKKRHKTVEMNLEFYDCIKDIVTHPVVLQMKNYYQHCDTDCYEHCLNVAYNNFRICKYLGLDARSAARGGMLHDLFLYDWHDKDLDINLHGFYHPGIALRNAEKAFVLDDKEKEIIKKHMWPLTVVPPKCREAYVICYFDKTCNLKEVFKEWGVSLRKLMARGLVKK